MKFIQQQQRLTKQYLLNQNLQEKCFFQLNIASLNLFDHFEGHLRLKIKISQEAQIIQSRLPYTRSNSTILINKKIYFQTYLIKKCAQYSYEDKKAIIELSVYAKNGESKNYKIGQIQLSLNEVTTSNKFQEFSIYYLSKKYPCPQISFTCRMIRNQFGRAKYQESQSLTHNQISKCENKQSDQSLTAQHLISIEQFKIQNLEGIKQFVKQSEEPKIVDQSSFILSKNYFKCLVYQLCEEINLRNERYTSQRQFFLRQLKQKNKSIQQIKFNHQQYISRIAEILDQNHRLSCQIQHAQLKNTLLQKQVESLRILVDNLQRQEKKNNKLIEEFQKQQQRLKDIVEKYEVELAQKIFENEFLQKLQQVMKEKKKEKINLEFENQQINENSSVNNQINQLQSEVLKRQKNILFLKILNNRVQREYDSLKKMFQEQEKIIQSLKQQKKNSEQAIYNLRHSFLCQISKIINQINIKIFQNNNYQLNCYKSQYFDSNNLHSLKKKMSKNKNSQFQKMKNDNKKQYERDSLLKKYAFKCRQLQAQNKLLIQINKFKEKACHLVCLQQISNENLGHFIKQIKSLTHFVENRQKNQFIQILKDIFKIDLERKLKNITNTDYLNPETSISSKENYNDEFTFSGTNIHEECLIIQDSEVLNLKLLNQQPGYLGNENLFYQNR